MKLFVPILLSILNKKPNRSKRHQIARTGAFLLSLSALLSLAVALELLNSDTLAIADLHASQQSNVARLQELKSLIDIEIGEPHANEPSQCRLIGFGSKPCGGPRTYLIYSTVKINEPRLKQLVIEYNQVQKRDNIERKAMSNCALARKPKIEVRNGVCTAVDELKENWELWRQQRLDTR